MTKSFPSWTVLEHGPLRQLQDNLHYVDGALRGMPLRRCMNVAHMASGGLVIHNAVALDEATMAKLDALGPVEYILVPSGLHRLDAPNFHKRYPEARILCPSGARKKVEAVVPVDGDYEDFPKDADVQLHTLEGLKGAEGVMLVRSGAELSMVFNDVLFNVSRESGGFLLWMLGATGGPKVEWLVRFLYVKNKSALRADLERLARLDGLCRLVPGHGDIIEDNAAEALRFAAQRL